MNINVNKTEQYLCHCGCPATLLSDGLYQDLNGSIFAVSCNIAYQLNNVDASDSASGGMSEGFVLKAMAVARGDKMSEL